MFTGIITDIGTIEHADQRGDLRLVIGCSYDMDHVAIGASIACSGICLTVVDKGARENSGWFAVDLSGETVSCSAKGLWNVGTRLNLERALKVGDELGGHIVTGHVDGIGEIASIVEDGGSKRITIKAGPDIAPFIAAKGSVTLDGVSLTVNDVQDEGAAVIFGVNIIPHTATVTTLGKFEAGQAINIEIDVLARYLGRMRDVLEKRVVHPS